MNVIVIDDQKAVVDSIYNNLAWKEPGIDEAFTAYSAKDARAVFSREHIDIMLSDIEMPEESGLSLFRYVKKISHSTECIFLTSHADFSYAQEALRLGSFEYILQPCRYEEIAQTIKKVIVKVTEKQHALGFSANRQELINTMGARLLHASGEENIEKIIPGLFGKKYDDGVFFPAEIAVVTECKRSIRGEIEKTVKSVFASKKDISVIIMEISHCDYIVLCYGPAPVLRQPELYGGMNEVFLALNTIENIKTAVYAGTACGPDLCSEIRQLHSMHENNILQKPVITEIQPVPEVSKDYLCTLHPERWTGILENGNGLVIKEEIRHGYFVLSARKLYENGS